MTRAPQDPLPDVELGGPPVRLRVLGLSLTFPTACVCCGRASTTTLEVLAGDSDVDWGAIGWAALGVTLMAGGVGWGPAAPFRRGEGGGRWVRAPACATCRSHDRSPRAALGVGLALSLVASGATALVALIQGASRATLAVAACATACLLVGAAAALVLAQRGPGCTRRAPLRVVSRGAEGFEVVLGNPAVGAAVRELNPASEVA